MSVDVTKIVEVIGDVTYIGASVMLVLIAIESKDLIKDFLIALIYGDPNDPSNYDFDNSSGKFDSDGKW